MPFHPGGKLEAYPFVGDLVTCKASMNMVGRTSMEVGVRVEAEILLTGEVHHTASAYLTYVALDEYLKPREISPLILESEAQERRSRQALKRKETRRKERESEIWVRAIISQGEMIESCSDDKPFPSGLFHGICKGRHHM